MDMFTVVLNNNREYVIELRDAELSEEDAFHIMRRMVFEMEQKKLAKELSMQNQPNVQNEVAGRIAERLKARKANS